MKYENAISWGTWTLCGCYLRGGKFQVMTFKKAMCLYVELLSDSVNNRINKAGEMFCDQSHYIAYFKPKKHYKRDIMQGNVFIISNLFY